MSVVVEDDEERLRSELVPMGEMGAEWYGRDGFEIDSGVKSGGSDEVGALRLRLRKVNKRVSPDSTIAYDMSVRVIL